MNQASSANVSVLCKLSYQINDIFALCIISYLAQDVVFIKTREIMHLIFSLLGQILFYVIGLL